MANHQTRKDWRNRDVEVGRGWKKQLKKFTARANRHRSIDDETPYKKLDDPWFYD